MIKLYSCILLKKAAKGFLQANLSRPQGFRI